MINLPKSYMNVIRDMTGHWGTYPPSATLEPGAVGKVVNGIFVKEGHLRKFEGYDINKHGLEETSNDDADSRWTTSGVTIEMLDAKAKVSMVPATVRMTLNFKGAEQALIVCRGAAIREFADLEEVKELMRNLLQKDKWDRDLCIITRVFAVRSALIFFSKDKGQSAQVEASGKAPIPLHPLPLAILQASAGAKLTISQFTGFFTDLPSGGTPLFMCIRFKKSWVPFTKDKIVYSVKGGDDDFEEPPLGEC